MHGIEAFFNRHDQRWEKREPTADCDQKDGDSPSIFVITLTLGEIIERAKHYGFTKHTINQRSGSWADRLRVPTLELLHEAPARAGFFETDRYEAVRRLLPEDLRVALTFSYT